MTALPVETGDRPPLLVPAPAPTLGHLSVGWSVFERTPADSDYWPRGGVVVHVDPHSAPDPETGEMVDRVLLVKAHQRDLVWVNLRADQLAAESVKRPNARTVRGVCQVAARLLARCGDDDERALELWSLGARLMAALARPGSVPAP